MNTGILSTRYARALYEYCEETGGAERVFKQVYILLRHPEHTPERLEPELERFVTLLVKNGRLEYVKFILRSYLRMYCDSRGMKFVSISSAVHIHGLTRKIRRIVEEKFQCKALIEDTVDPNLIGGFVVRVNDLMIDASVRNQIESIRRHFIVQNNRIV